MTITRIWQGGADTGVSEFHSHQNPENFFPHTLAARTGTYGYYVAGYTSVGTKLPHGVVYNPATRQVRGGFYKYSYANYNYGLLLGLYTASNTYLCGIEQATPSAGLAMAIDVNAVNVDDDTNLNQTDWAHYAFDVKIHASTGWFYVYKNGNLVLSFDGDTGDADIGQIKIGHVGYNDQSYNWYLDDIYFDDTTGEGSAAAPPLLRFYYLSPDGNGNYAQWDGSDGNSTDNYQLIDEIPPSESDFIETNVTDEYDSHTMTSITLDTGQTIEAVIPIVYASREGSSEKIALGTRYSSTDVIGSDQVPSVSTGFLWERQTTKPGGGAWDQTSLNGFETVVKSRGTY
jgi:hypothetical protein